MAKEVAQNVEFCPSCGYHRTPSEPICPVCSHLFEYQGDLLISRELRNRWKLEARLGEGGMGMIYQGSCLETNKKVAIKLMRTQVSISENSIRRFYREAKTLQKIGHPNIIKVYEFGFEEQIGFFLSMELLRGCSLEEYIDVHGLQITPEILCKIMAQVCDAMEYAHNQGVIHRDLKPDNIFLVGGPNATNMIKLIDFGIAKLKDDDGSKLTQSGAMVGTPRYASPEQVLATPLSPQTDIYALSAILYELLTEQHLFEATTAYDYLMHHVNMPPTPISEARRDLQFPPGLEELVDEGLSKNPKDRPRSMHEFKERLLSLYQAEHPQLIYRLMQSSRLSAQAETRPTPIPTTCVQTPNPGQTEEIPSSEQLLQAGSFWNTQSNETFEHEPTQKQSVFQHHFPPPQHIPYDTNAPLPNQTQTNSLPLPIPYPMLTPNPPTSFHNYAPYPTPPTPPRPSPPPQENTYLQRQRIGTALAEEVLIKQRKRRKIRRLLLSGLALCAISLALFLYTSGIFSRWIEPPMTPPPPPPLPSTSYNNDTQTSYKTRKQRRPRKRISRRKRSKSKASSSHRHHPRIRPRIRIRRSH